MADSKLRVLVSVEDLASRAIRKVTDGLGDMAKEGQSAQKKMQQFSQAMMGVNQALELVKKVARGVKVAFEFAEAGKGIENAEARLAAFVGGAVEAEKVIKAMDEALDGGATRFQIATEASRMFELKLADSAEEAAMLSQAITTTGGNMQDFSLMIANESYRRLDLYGIAVSDVKNRMKVLAVEQKNLTSQERFAIATKEELKRKMDMLTEAGYDAVTAYDKLRTSVGNLSDRFKLWVNEGMEPAIKKLNTLFDLMEEATDTRDTLTEAYERGIITETEYGSLINSQRFAVDHYEESVAELAIALANLDAKQMLANDTMKQSARSYELAQGNMEAYGATVEKTAGFIAINSKEAENHDAIIAALDGTLGEQIETIAEMQLQYEGMTEWQKKYGDGAGMAEDIAEGLQDVNDKLMDMTARTAVLQLLESGLEGSAQAAYNLAYDMGLIDDATYKASMTMANLNDYLSDTSDIGGYAAATKYLADNLDRLTDRTFTVTQIHQSIYQQQIAGGVAQSGDIRDYYSSGGAVGALPNIGQATGTHGQWQSVPGGYNRDNYTVGMTSGEEYMVRSRGEVANGTSTGANVSIVINETTSARETASQVVQALKLQGVVI